MAANTAPISPAAPAISWNATVITAANTAMDGTGTVGTCFTAGANGSKVGRVKIVPVTAPGAPTNVASVMRFFVNNGASSLVAANNALIGEITLPAVTVSQTAAATPIELALNIVLKPGYKLNYTLGTAVAAGHAVTCPDAGDY